MPRGVWYSPIKPSQRSGGGGGAAVVLAAADAAGAIAVRAQDVSTNDDTTNAVKSLEALMRPGAK
jgi:hypothetical protein